MKKYFKWAAIAFVLFYLVTQPVQSAYVVHNAVAGLGSAAGSLSQFVNRLP